MPSGNGKKASDAATQFLIFSGTNCDAFCTAILQLSNLLGCPAPIPIVDFPFTKTIAFDLTNLQILKANFRLINLAVFNFFFVTILSFLFNKVLSES